MNIKHLLVAGVAALSLLGGLSITTTTQAASGRTTSSIIGKAHKHDTGWFTKHNYVFPKGKRDGEHLGKNLSHSNIKLNSGTIYRFKNNDSTYSFYAYAKNGHRVFLGKYHSYALEAMPGLYTSDSHFTNHTGHWVIYFVAGNGVSGQKGTDDEGFRVSTPISGFKEFNKLYDPVALHFPEVGECLSTSSSNVLYNWNKKILISTPAINYDNYAGYNEKEGSLTGHF